MLFDDNYVRKLYDKKTGPNEVIPSVLLLWLSILYGSIHFQAWSDLEWYIA